MTHDNDKHPIYKEFLNSIPKPIIHDAGGGVIYRGFTTNYGVGQDEKRWKIERETTAGGITLTEYAGGRGEYKFSWDERETLSYSR